MRITTRLNTWAKISVSSIKSADHSRKNRKYRSKSYKVSISELVSESEKKPVRATNVCTL